MSIYRETFERLQGYYPFEEQLTDEVSTVAATQKGLSYEQFMKFQGIPEPQVFEPVGAKPHKILDIRPKDHDPAKARVMLLAMANDLDANQMYQMATVFAADPTTRLIAVGNPGAPGHKLGGLSLKNAVKVFKGDARPLVDPVLQYVAEQDITEVEYTGFSYGSARTTAAMLHADRYDHMANGIAIEPADIKARRGGKIVAMATLGIDFASTGKALGGYVKASDTPAFEDARKRSPGMIMYSAGLLRPSNLAISSVMAGSFYEDRARSALEAQPTATLHTIWGSESELAHDETLSAITNNLWLAYGDRAQATRLPGQKHNMVNDIHLQAALVRHASNL